MKFSRHISLFLMVLAVASNASFSQPFGNEWINADQVYYKIPTAENGVYRITYNDLDAAGFPVNSVDPQKIQLFHRGKEQAIDVEGQTDARFDPSDFIDFYGERNDGTLDAELYVKPDAQPHQYYNLYSDTTAYFLTWSLTTNGKRMPGFKEGNTNGLPPEPYHMNEKLLVQTSNYSVGLHYPLGSPGAESYLSAFDYGEGWTGRLFQKGKFEDHTFSGLDDKYALGPAPVLDLLLAGQNSLQHKAEILVGPSATSLRKIGEVTFNFHYTKQYQDTLEWTDISSSGDLVVRVNDVGVDAGADAMSISYIKIKYPALYHQDGEMEKVYNLPPNANNKSYIEIDGVPANAAMFDITDPSNVGIIGFDQVGSAVNAIVPNTFAGKKLLVTSRRIAAPKIRKAGFRKIVPSASDYLIITNAYLRQATQEYPDPPKAYASYRASAAGGGYDTLLINVGQLYDEFSYGETTSLAIYRFVRYMLSTGNPKYLFIIGKGLVPSYNFHRKDFATATTRDLVPTGGFPGSDIVFSAGLKGTSHEPAIPTGRIAVNNAEQAAAYLDKIKEMEATPFNALWRKEFIHLSGGKGAAEQNLFLNYVNGFKSIAEGEYFGGNVITKSKKTNNATELINISDLVNQGKAFITFFGHSGTFATDIEIGNVTNDGLGYHNQGKYPVIVVNGCNAGDMFNASEGFGENWIVTANKGAVGFIAHTNVGLSSKLVKYTGMYYQTAYADSSFFGKGIGDIQKEASRRYLQTSMENAIDIGQVQQMSLDGDPAYKLFKVKTPDFNIAADNIFVQSSDGQPVTVNSEKFNLGIIVQNFGVALNDSLQITVSRKLSDGKAINLDTLWYKPVFYQDTVYFPIKAAGAEAFGNNQFTVTLDPGHRFRETDRSNNQATYDYFLPLGGTANLQPKNHAIANQQELTLTAQSLDLLMGSREFLFELDTAAAFNSPIKQTASIQAHTVAKWPVKLFQQFAPKDSLVFYWRVKYANPRPDEIESWSTTSFTYINNSPPGWSMSHAGQFPDIKSNELVFDQKSRKWEFKSVETQLSVKTYGPDDADHSYQDVKLQINDAPFIYETRFCTDNSINLLAFDQSTTQPYLGIKFGVNDVLDRRSCGRPPQVVNNFLKKEIEQDLWVEKYIDAVKDGDMVLVFSIGKVTYDTWPASTVSKLEQIGASAAVIQALADGYPFILLGKKGAAPGSAIMVTPDLSSTVAPGAQELDLNETIKGSYSSGTANSPAIGPAKHWQTLDFNLKPSEQPVTDTWSLAVYGGKDQDNPVLLLDNLKNSPVDLSSVNASNYPYLTLRLHTEDTQNFTPEQLRRWTVLYDGVPDGVLKLGDGQPVSGVSKQEGDTLATDLSFENVSPLDFPDSIKVQYTLFNQDQRKSFTDTLTIAPPAPGKQTNFKIIQKTKGRTGKNDLTVFANPYILPEQTYNNNRLDMKDYATVESDNTNPILEVTVDGQFIMDGDIVSPSPLIKLRLKDENKVLLKEDTTGVGLYLKKPCDGCDFERISFSSPRVLWSPATQNSDFSLEYQPENLPDGIYTIKAQAIDASGNLSGTEPYTVRFEVVNESQITNFYPYPNPFSTSTRFVFTLTGGEIPENIIIQIMTVSGRVVREITQDELGPIKIGNNISQYAWDGTDEFGDKLANGVYLYRVKVRLHGQDIKQRATAADRAFKHGIGKLYILR